MASRRWLAVVVLLFCLPLFFGLRNRDLENDEAIYSFAVDRILEDGEWLQPKSSPSETVVFLEKPPLKFWIVAAPIRLGLLPDDEFGMRFWDALFGAAAFLYVFGIGSILAGPVCGLAAVLILFVHPPLLLEHGIRGNNMEAALLLSYCGGVYHFLRWSAEGAPRAGRHAAAAGVYFVLGFLTKFVAVIFLPAVLLLPALMFRRTRQKLLREWRVWARVAGLAAALIAPWFMYAQFAFGNELWRVMLAEHVYARFTSGLNPTHIQPWHYYFSTIWAWLVEARAEWLVAAGALVLTVQAARRRWFEAAVVIAWALLTLVPISLGSSKLYHYAYPFLPPVALAGGYLAGLVALLAPAQVRKIGIFVEDALARRPGFAAAADHRVVRATGAALIAATAVLAIATLFLGTVRLYANGQTLLRNSGVWRPLLVMALAAVMTRSSARIATFLTAFGVAMLLPTAAYKDMWERLGVTRHPIRDTSACVQRVQREAGATRPLRAGIGADSGSIMHPIFLYFRRVRPLTVVEPLSDDAISRAVNEPDQAWPMLVQDRRYQQYLESSVRLHPAAPTPPVATFFDWVVVLPGPYRACSSEASLLTQGGG